MNDLFQDLRFGLRMLCKSPGFSAVAVLVLTLAIGGTAAMFTVINALVLRPPAVPHPEELVRVYDKENKPGGGYRSLSYPNLMELREGTTPFRDIAGFTFAMVGVNEGDLTRRSLALIAGANYFSTFGVQMAAGRGFSPEEEKPGSAIPVVVVSHSYWQRLGSDPALVGKTLRINLRSFEVVGIAPEHFAGTTALFSPEFWLPLGMYEILVNDYANERKQRLDDRQNTALLAVARLKPGITMAAAQTRMTDLARRLEETHPESSKDRTFELGKLSRMSVNTNPQADSGSGVLIVLLMGMSGAVLLIACLNLANMLLARGAARKREIAIRLSLGAGRGRLVRQLLTEGFLLSLLGGVGGLLLAVWATKLLAASLAAKLPLLTIVFDARPDWRVLTATFGFCLLSVLLFGLGPAWRLSRLNVADDLKVQIGGETRGRGRHGLFALRNLLVAGQLALSLALLTAAGLFTHGAIKAGHANPGFSLGQEMLVETDASLAGYDETRGKQLYFDLLERLRALPGVQAASLAYVVPFGLFSDGCQVRRAGAAAAPSPGKESAESDKAISTGFNIVAADYFKTIGLPVLRGREFGRVEASASSAGRVAIIDEPLARRLWPGQEAVGHQIQLDDKDKETLEIVGVVPGVRDDLNTKELQPHLYVPFGQQYRGGMNLHLRVACIGREAELAMLRSIRETIQSVAPRLPILSVQTMQQFHEDGLLVWFVRTAARLFGVFGALALFLAVVGVYGVNAYVVAQRTREIGLRMALGATVHNVLWMVLRDGLRITAAGLAGGLLLALAVGFLLRSIVYGVTAADPLAFTVAPLCLAAAALLACYLPARRAAKVQPMVALRCE